MSNWHQDDFLRELPASEILGRRAAKTYEAWLKAYPFPTGTSHTEVTAPRRVPGLDQYFIDALPAIAARSKDTNQVGCIITAHDGRVMSTGHNGFPAQVEETPERWSRPAKYNYVVHAEANAIAASAKHGTHLHGSTAYVSFEPCTSCAKLLIAAGIFKVVVDKKNHDRVVTEKWEKDSEIVKQMFAESGVKLIFWTGEEK